MEVEIRKHPRGEPGTRISIEEAAKRAAAARIDPRVRAWAIEKIVQAGNPNGVVDRAQVLLEALRRERIYIEDPTDSDFMPSAACTLVGCQGLIFLGEDCDGLLIAWLGACGSIGIFGAVIGHSYSPSGQLSHVLGAVWDGTSRWYKADPSTKQAFGVVSQPTRERWVAVHDGRTLCDKAYGCDPRAVPEPMAVMRKHSEFVGLIGGSMQAGHQGIVGAPPPSSLFVGSEQDQAQMIEEVKIGREELASVVQDAMYEHEKLLLLREYLNKPLVDILQQQAGGVQQAPDSVSPDDLWTQTNEVDFQNEMSAALLALKYSDEAISGRRKLARRTDTQEVVILGKPEETSVQDDNGKLITGKAADAQIVQAGLVGYNWQVYAVMILGVMYVGLIAYGLYTVAHASIGAYKQHLMVAHIKEMNELYAGVIKNGGTHEQGMALVTQVGGHVAAMAKHNLEQQKLDPMAKLLETLETVLVVGMGAGVLVAGGWLLTQIIPVIGAMRPASKSA